MEMGQLFNLLVAIFCFVVGRRCAHIYYQYKDNVMLTGAIGCYLFSIVNLWFAFRWWPLDF